MSQQSPTDSYLRFFCRSSLRSGSWICVSETIPESVGRLSRRGNCFCSFPDSNRQPKGCRLVIGNTLISKFDSYSRSFIHDSIFEKCFSLESSNRDENILKNISSVRGKCVQPDVMTEASTFLPLRHKQPGQTGVTLTIVFSSIPLLRARQTGRVERDRRQQEFNKRTN